MATVTATTTAATGNKNIKLGKLKNVQENQI